MVASDETCDDGDAIDGNGCTNGCLVGHGYACDGAEPSGCTSDCGDGVVASDEACDDGDAVDDDGCTNACVAGHGFTCDGAEPSAASALPSYRDARAQAIQDFERSFLAKLVASTGGNIREAARVARMDRSHLMDLMRRHGMR